MSIDQMSGARVRAAQRRAPQHALDATCPSEYANSPLTFGMPSMRVVRRRRPRSASGSAPRGRSRTVLIATAVPPRPPARGPVDSLVGRAQLAARDDGAAADQQRVDRPRRAEHERGDRVGDAGAGRGRRAATARRRRACPARASRARPRGRGSARRSIVPSASASRAVSAAGPPAQPGDQQRLAQLALPARRPRWRRRRRRRGRPARPASEQRRDRRDAGAEPRVGARAVRDAGAGLAEAARPRRRSGARSGRATRRRRASRAPRGTRPAARRSARGRTPPRRAVSARCVCSRTPRRRASSAASRISSRGDRERRAGRQRDPHHRVRRRVVEAVDRRLAGGQDRVAVLDDLVGRQAAVRSARGPSSRGTGGSAGRSRRAAVDLDLEQVAGALAGRRSGGRWRSCSPSGPARPGPARAAAALDVARRAAPRPGRARSATRTASPAARGRAWPTGRGGGGS